MSTDELPERVEVYIDGTSLPDAIHQEYDLATIEEQLEEILDREGVGQFDGNLIGPTHAILFMYGQSAKALFAAVEATLRAYPLCQGAGVVLRETDSGK